MPAEDRRFRLSIHESADVEAAVRWWAGFVGVEAGSFQKTTLKRHRPTTVWRNTGESYRGYLIVTVLKSLRLYWQIEGMVMATLGECASS